MLRITRPYAPALVLMLTQIGFGFSAASSPAEVVFSSGEQQILLLELFTSEGCSSCPPADRWLSRLKRDPRLWRQVVPVAFHVDYWDRLGWKDRFSRAAWSQRQYRYAEAGLARTVYTPGFFANGQEWRGWVRNSPLPQPTQPAPGILALRINGDALQASFVPATPVTDPVLHVALLGMHRSTEVTRGENSGHRLDHDFVVLDLQSLPGPANDGHPQWRLRLPGHTKAEAIAAWITSADNPRPLQSVGGWLTPMP